MALTSRSIAQAAYVVGEEIARRRRIGVPIPRHLTELHRALLGEVSASGQRTGETSTATTTLETTAQRAQRLGVSERTIRRRAAARGDKRIGKTYVFERP